MRGTTAPLVNCQEDGPFGDASRTVGYAYLVIRLGTNGIGSPVHESYATYSGSRTPVRT